MFQTPPSDYLMTERDNSPLNQRGTVLLESLILMTKTHNGSILVADIRRLGRGGDGSWLIADPSKPCVMIDLQYSNMPDFSFVCHASGRCAWR